MRFGIVEGEPGIFPDPVARLIRLFRRPLPGRRRKRQAEANRERDEGGQDGPARATAP